jgi:hypothetical protein
MQTKFLNIAHLLVNPWNPNLMTDSMFEHLSTTISVSGFLQPVLVWQRADGHMIIDGEHRWKALKKNGATTIEAKVLDDNDMFNIGKEMKKRGLITIDVEQMNQGTLIAIAKALTLNMNETRGESDPLKKAELVHSLKPIFSEEQLTSVLNIPPEELKALELMLQMNKEDMEKAVKSLKDKPKLSEIRIIVDDHKLNIITTAITHIGIPDKGEAIAEICRLYCESQGVQVPSELELRDESPQETEVPKETEVSEDGSLKL